MTDPLLPLPAMRLLTRRLLAILLLTVPAWLPAFAAEAGPHDPVVVVSPRNPLSALRYEQVAAIFMAQTDRFPDGAEAVAKERNFVLHEHSLSLYGFCGDCADNINPMAARKLRRS